MYFKYLVQCLSCAVLVNVTFIVEDTRMSLSVLKAQCVYPSDMVLLSQGIWCLSHLMVWSLQDMKKQSYIEGNDCDLPCMKSVSPISIDVLMDLSHVGWCTGQGLAELAFFVHPTQQQVQERGLQLQEDQWQCLALGNSGSSCLFEKSRQHSYLTRIPSCRLY